MDVSIFSVVYPGVEPFIPEFLNSLSNQIDKDFVLFIINDGLVDFEKFLGEVDFDVQVKSASGYPAELRTIGINWVISNGFEIIIFADSDDYFDSMRVAISRRLLSKFDIVCNELILIGKEISEPVLMLGNFLKENEEITREKISRCNCFGLSNTAVQVKSIPKNIKLIPKEILAFDWAFFSLCLHEGSRAVFTSKTKTFYRQHGNNIAAPNCFSEQQIKRGIKVKKEHYQFLFKWYDEYELLAKGFGELYCKLNTDSLLSQKYCNAVKGRVSGLPLWWESIKLLEELGI